MKYSIIIPTMWFHVEQLLEMLAIYNCMRCVGEILVINNDNTKRIKLPFSKVRVLGNGNNIYVNPSWKLGVLNTKYRNVVLINDDIIVRGDLTFLFEKISYILRKGVIVGASKVCYSKYNNLESKIKIKKVQFLNRYRHIMNYGFGVFMFMQKSTFLNTLIPVDLKVWYGDRILFIKNESWVFSGIEIITNMQGTTSKIDLRGFAVKEKIAFKKYLNNIKENGK